MLGILRWFFPLAGAVDIMAAAIMVADITAVAIMAAAITAADTIE